ncbi:MAG TPA: DUF1015 domain-containing protein [Candidatus Binatia bacterium]|jgi:uncharacterized protein (DUF1015 family)|nr:DUF1015 domain-containing protein [Candidatus Binatia bacterium]
MALIRPFRGVRYDPAVVGDLQQVVSPPYDVISAEQQTVLHLRSPYNAVRLDLNRDVERYSSAAKTLRDWLERGVLIQDQEPSLYCYTQEFTLKDGSHHTRAGVLAALRLEEFSAKTIRPHERTFESAKNDRLALLRACQAHLSPVFLLYSKPAWSLTQTLAPALAAPALVTVEDDQQTRHQLWRITDQAFIAGVAAGLAHEPLIIADGHHRYETALHYRAERVAAQKHSGGDEPFNYVLAYLTNVWEGGVVILPTHRLLREGPLPSSQHLRAVLQRDFRIVLFSPADPQAFFAALRAPGSERRIGCALAGASHSWVLSFDERVTQGLPVSASLRAVDVTVLHDVIFQRFLGFPPEVQKQRLAYTVDEEEALRWVAERRCQAAFFLNPTTFAQVAEVCGHGETMPQKSTYFFPKLLTGLVFYRL